MHSLLLLGSIFLLSRRVSFHLTLSFHMTKLHWNDSVTWNDTLHDTRKMDPYIILLWMVITCHNSIKCTIGATWLSPRGHFCLIMLQYKPPWIHNNRTLNLVVGMRFFQSQPMFATALTHIWNSFCMYAVEKKRFVIIRAFGTNTWSYKKWVLRNIV